jgi:hypothetical protein
MGMICEKKIGKVWGCSYHVVKQFVERNKFINTYNEAMEEILKMMEKATFVCYEKRDKMAEIWTSGKWIIITKESAIVTIYKKKGSKFEKLTA